MIKDIVVEVERRSETGKNACRRMRAQGMVPGVVYGLDSDPFPVAVSPRRIGQVLREETGRNTIFKLQLADDTAQQRSVMLKELQRDPITEDLLHVDFVRLDLTQSIQVQVPDRAGRHPGRCAARRGHPRPHPPLGADRVPALGHPG